METVLQGIPNVCVYLDDVLVTGPTNEEHLKTLDQVLSRLEEVFLHATIRRVPDPLHLHRGSSANRREGPSPPQGPDTRVHEPTEIILGHVELL